jgi:uncharacterized membrane protein
MSSHRPIGKRLLPVRFLAFLGAALVAVPVAITFAGWAIGTMIGFDIAALLFLGLSAPLLGDDAKQMREAARRNDANRVIMLAISTLSSVAVLAAVAGELGGQGKPGAGTIALVVATLMLAWVFGNVVFALHYAHLFYLEGDEGKDAGGIDIPGADEPVYWDFVYFSFTLGMTFQTSDVDIQTTQLRRIATAHSLIAFIFNLGIVAFTINVLGGG